VNDVQQCEPPPDRVLGTPYMVMLISETVCAERLKPGAMSVGSIPDEHVGLLTMGFFFLFKSLYIDHVLVRTCCLFKE
jgi:hypothetical protein